MHTPLLLIGASLKSGARAARPQSKGTRPRAHRLLPVQGFRSAAQKNQVQRSRDSKDSGLSDQKLHVAGAHDDPALPLSLANRVVLQVDQSFLGHRRKRGQNSNLNCRVGLRADSDCQKAARPACQPLRDFTKPESDNVRANFIKSPARVSRAGVKSCRFQCSIDFVRLTLGRY